MIKNSEQKCDVKMINMQKSDAKEVAELLCDSSASEEMKKLVQKRLEYIYSRDDLDIAVFKDQSKELTGGEIVGYLFVCLVNREGTTAYSYYKWHRNLRYNQARLDLTANLASCLKEYNIKQLIIKPQLDDEIEIFKKAGFEYGTDINFINISDNFHSDIMSDTFFELESCIGGNYGK